MGTKSLKNTICIIIAAVYFFTNTGFASLGQSNIWKDRQTNIQNRASRQLSNASLLHHQTSTFSKTRQSKAEKNVSVERIINVLPKNTCTISETINEKSKTPPVIFIEDIHLNPEAQANIAQVVLTLANQNKIDLVGIEGAFSPIDFSSFHKLADADLLKGLADDFLKKGELAAASYAGLLNKSAEVTFVGIDDKLKHQENVQAYLAAQNEKNTLKESIHSQEIKNIELQKTILNPKLHEILALIESHRREGISLSEYLTRLSQISEIEKSLTIQQFLEASSLERRINFDLAEKEKSQILASLSEKLSPAELENLSGLSEAYTRGNIRADKLLLTLRALCDEKKVPLTKTPNLEMAIRYTISSHEIMAEQLFHEINNLEQQSLDKWALNLEEKRIIAEANQIYLKKKLLEFSLNSDEWKTLTKQSNASSQWRFFENFYKRADERSQLMVTNLLKYPSTRSRVIIAGGFHKSVLLKLLEQKNIPIVVVRPRVSHIETNEGVKALSFFSQAKTPLDKLFDGEKLFLAPAEIQFSSTGLREKFSLLERIEQEFHHPNSSNSGIKILSSNEFECEIGEQKIKGTHQEFPTSKENGHYLHSSFNEFNPQSLTNLSFLRKLIYFVIGSPLSKRHLSIAILNFKQFLTSEKFLEGATNTIFAFALIKVLIIIDSLNPANISFIGKTHFSPLLIGSVFLLDRTKSFANNLRHWTTFGIQAKNRKEILTAIQYFETVIRYGHDKALTYRARANLASIYRVNFKDPKKSLSYIEALPEAIKTRSEEIQSQLDEIKQKTNKEPSDQEKIDYLETLQNFLKSDQLYIHIELACIYILMSEHETIASEKLKILFSALNILTPIQLKFSPLLATLKASIYRKLGSYDLAIQTLSPDDGRNVHAYFEGDRAIYHELSKNISAREKIRRNEHFFRAISGLSYGVVSGLFLLSVPFIWKLSPWQIFLDVIILSWISGSWIFYGTVVFYNTWKTVPVEGFQFKVMSSLLDPIAVSTGHRTSAFKKINLTFVKNTIDVHELFPSHVIGMFAMLPGIHHLFLPIVFKQRKKNEETSVPNDPLALFKSDEMMGHLINELKDSPIEDWETVKELMDLAAQIKKISRENPSLNKKQWAVTALVAANAKIEQAIRESNTLVMLHHRALLLDIEVPLALSRLYQENKNNNDGILDSISLLNVALDRVRFHKKRPDISIQDKKKIEEILEPVVQISLAFANSLLGRIQRGIDVLEKPHAGLRWNLRENEAALDIYANLLERSGQLDQAIDVLGWTDYNRKKVVLRFPKNMIHRITLSRILLKQKRIKEGLDLFMNPATHQPDLFLLEKQSMAPEARLIFAALLSAQGKHKEAFEFINQKQARFYNRYKLNLLNSLLVNRMGDRNKAVQTLYSHFPSTDYSYVLQRALVLEELEKYEEAFDLITNRIRFGNNHLRESLIEWNEAGRLLARLVIRMHRPQTPPSLSPEKRADENGTDKPENNQGSIQNRFLTLMGGVSILLLSLNLIKLPSGIFISTTLGIVLIGGLLARQSERYFETKKQDASFTALDSLVPHLENLDIDSIEGRTSTIPYTKTFFSGIRELLTPRVKYIWLKGTTIEDLSSEMKRHLSLQRNKSLHGYFVVSQDQKEVIEKLKGEIGSQPILIISETSHVWDLFKNESASTIISQEKQFIIPKGINLPQDFFDPKEIPLNDEDKINFFKNLLVYVLTDNLERAIPISANQLGALDTILLALVQA